MVVILMTAATVLAMVTMEMNINTHDELNAG